MAEVLTCPEDKLSKCPTEILEEIFQYNRLEVLFWSTRRCVMLERDQSSGTSPWDKGMGGRYVDFLYTICRYIATIHTDIVEKLTRSVTIVSQKNGHYFLNQHYLYKDRLYLLVRQDLLK